MYKVVIDHAPSEADNDFIKEGLISEYEHIVGERDKPFLIFLKNENKNIFGGIQARLDNESVYIEILWIEKNLRKRGYGKKLLAAAEQEAIRNGCCFSTTDTWDFQVEDFYLRCGYKRIAEIENYWLGHSKIFLRKDLKI